MIGQTLVLVCAAFGLAAGSCVSVPTQLSSNVVLPDFFSGSGCATSGQVFSGSVVSSPLVSGALVSSPLVSDGFSGSFVSGGNVLLGSGIGANFDGPETAPLPPVQAPSVTLPTVESPMVTLSAPAIPAPRVLASRCVCTKTIVKPQVYQRVVTVPKVQRYFKRTVTPVVENLVYKSRPLSSGNSAGYSGSSVMSSGVSSGFVGTSSGSSSVLVSGNGSPVCVSGSSQGRVCC